MIVLDTNIVLDLFVFNDPATQPLQQALATQQLRWLATPAMRVELERVLGYKQIVPRLACYQRTAAGVLAQFDHHAQLTAAAPKAGVRCTDPDDQQFIDLAVAHQALLLSKDQAVLCLHKRLLALGVRVLTALPALGDKMQPSFCAAIAPNRIAP
jgi:putative PIN family toxin of toxin-antitoxin system